MRKILLGGLVVAGITLTGCAQVGDALSSLLNIFKVAFSLDETQGTKGVDYEIQYPQAFTNNAAAIKSLLGRAASARSAGNEGLADNIIKMGLSGFGISSLDDFLAQTKLSLKFNVKADNSGNKHKAAFPFETGLGLFVRDLNNADPTTTSTLKPFEVPAAGTTAFQIPVDVPFTLLKKSSITDDVIAGNSIPYKVNGNFKFALVPTAGDTVAKDSTTMNLVTSAISTRPTTGSSASLFDTFTSLLSYLK